MSEVVTGVVKLTFGFLANKIRSGIAERLKDGDVTDEECRRLIVRELDDIKSKLDGLARKDLLSSLCFLKEGVNGLYQSLLQLDSNENTAESTGQATLLEAASSRDTGPDSPINEAIALINAITSLKIRSNDHFKSAIESFKLAREKATEAFCNEALSIVDRIQASQIRMMARIFEKLEHPDASASDCLQYIQELHAIGAIQEIFSVLIDGGIKSRFNKTKRLNNASSVQVMNQVLFEFVKKFTQPSLLARISAWPTILLGNASSVQVMNQVLFEFVKTFTQPSLVPRISAWPTILLGEKTYHPVLGEDRIIEKLKGTGMQVMSLGSDFIFSDEIYHSLYSVVNSKGDIVARTSNKHTFKVCKRSGESRTLCEVPNKEHASEYVDAMDIDAEDNLYVITSSRDRDDQPLSFKLSVFDENGNKKLECPLPVHSGKVYMAINKDGKIAILNFERNILYIGNICVELNSFRVDKSLSVKELNVGYSLHVSIRFSDFNGTKIIAANDDTVYIYTEDGQVQRKIKIPDEHPFIESVAINHVTKRILVKTLQQSLLSFSETGELIDNLCLRWSRKWIRQAQLKSHPNGPIALVSDTRAALLQL
jgi:hypothetical protein